jgi:hypothetical protein
MNTQRIHSSADIPAIDLSSQASVPLLSPQSLADIQLHAPPEVSKLLRKLRWSWFFDISCNIAQQHRDLGVLGHQGEVEDATILASNDITLNAEAAAHAWVMALAQRAAMEIRQLEQVDSPRSVLPQGVSELAGVAFFATSENARGSGRRLTAALQRLAGAVTLALGAHATVEFVYRRSVQLASPVKEKCAIPMAAYRIRYRSCTSEQVRGIISKIVKTQTFVEDNNDKLMLSQS